MLAHIDTLSISFPAAVVFDRLYPQILPSLQKVAESRKQLPHSQDFQSVKVRNELGVERTFNELMSVPRFYDDHEVSFVWGFEVLLGLMGLPFGVVEEIFPGKNNFRHSVRLDHGGSFFAFGGNNRVMGKDGNMIQIPERIQLYLTGETCAKVERSHWLQLESFLNAVDGARITRCDVCVDDIEGRFDLKTAIKAFDGGMFDPDTGRPPEMTYTQKRVRKGKQTSGETIYIGSRKSGKLARIYEKGKQLGDGNSEWVRWELEISNKDRVIPFDILSQPECYFCGSYKMFAFVHEKLTGQWQIPETVKTERVKENIVYHYLKNHARTAYGRLINYLQHLGMTAEDIIADLSHPSKEYPARLQWSEV